MLQATKEAARLLHENDMRSQAKVLFEAAFERHPELLTTEDKNLFLDLLLVLEEYQQALEICCRFERLISYIWWGWQGAAMLYQKTSQWLVIRKVGPFRSI